MIVNSYVDHTTKLSIYSCEWFVLEKEDGDIFEEKKSFGRFLKINKCNKGCLSHEYFGNIL